MFRQHACAVCTTEASFEMLQETLVLQWDKSYLLCRHNSSQFH